MSSDKRENEKLNVNFTVTNPKEKFEISNELIKMCISNLEYYKKDKSFAGSKIHSNFEKFKKLLESSIPVIKEIESFSHLYDYDENTPGNGYRSFVYIFECALKYSKKIFDYITEHRASLLFRKNLYLKELEVCTQMIKSIYQICTDLIKMHNNSDVGNLYSKEYTHDNLITRSAKVIDQTCFYGRSVGFQFVDSMRNILKFLSVTLACFSEAYFSNGFKFMKTTNYFLKHPSYFMDPEMCARRIINVSHNADVRFCKSFWTLGESKLIHALPRLVGYKVDVNRVFKIPPEPLEIYSEKLGKNIEIPVPSSHIGRQPVSCRLLSSRHRKGMVGEGQVDAKLAAPSKYLLIHTHGGGWLATSSKSHEFYLREWANKLDIPILSIDYALCPKAPFPRGLEDVFYTYCWILKNCELLGTTGENIVFCGDSAGANLNTACIVKCIEMGVPLPTGIFNAYSPFLVNFASSPARFLTLVDPLVPYGFIMRIFKCYGASKPLENKSDLDNLEDTNEHEMVTDIKDEIEGNTLLSADSSKCLELVWQKVKNTTDPSDWQSNLNSIEENLSEDPISPLIYRSDSIFEPNVVEDDGDDDVLEMKISKRNEEPKEEQNENSNNTENFREVNIEGSHRYNRTLSEDNVTFYAVKNSTNVTEKSDEKLTLTLPQYKTISSTSTEQNESLKRNYAFTEKSYINDIPKAPEDEFVFSVPRNYLMSPYLASDEILKQFPKTSILSTITDPCVDDCIEFAKKLRGLKVDIRMDVVGALNHGFLNFAHVSKECHDASMMCLKRIAELLKTEIDI